MEDEPLVFSDAARDADTNAPVTTSGRHRNATAFAVVVAVLAVALPFAARLVIPALVALLGRGLGWYLCKKTEGRRAQLLGITEDDERGFRESHGIPEPEKKPKDSSDTSRDWDGIVGFFHPFCNAGGGGERVLWAAIRATQEAWPNAKCVVYTGDHDASKEVILDRVKTRFNIDLHPPTITFLYLSARHWVLASTWPHFTLLGQSIGSVILAWDAFQLLVPDIFVDTMGYAFALGLARFLFGSSVPLGAYVHYPTISTDMLESLDPNSGVGSQGANAGKGVGFRGTAKTVYWKLFARLYSRVGASADVVMTNSSWTQMHIQKLWGRARGATRRRRYPIEVVYPPVAVSELEEKVEVSAEAEACREKVLLYIAQFRPEKNHQLVVNAFAAFLKAAPAHVSGDARLVLVGSVRDDADSKRVYRLRLLVNELGVRNRVDFRLDATWPEILDWLGRASVGVNGMWNEHFGIGVVEYQAAGLISVVHDSGGPKLDIVTEIDGGPTGFRATTVEEFADGFTKALSLDLESILEMRGRARRSAKRFTEETFAHKWTEQMDRLVALKVKRR